MTNLTDNTITSTKYRELRWLSSDDFFGQLFAECYIKGEVFMFHNELTGVKSVQRETSQDKSGPFWDQSRPIGVNPNQLVPMWSMGIGI